MNGSCRHYLEYKQLKKKLKKVIVATRDDTTEAAHHEQEGFQRALDSEVRGAFHSL